MSDNIIDFSKLPPPQVIVPVTYEEILSRNIADFMAAAPEYSGIGLESDPIVKWIQNVSTREYMLELRINDAAVARLLLLAEKENLDYLGADYEIERLVLVEEDLTVIPPIQKVMEGDESFRIRIRERIAGWSTAGTVYHYQRNARLNQPLVADVKAFSPQGGAVTIAVMSTTNDGIVPPEVMASITEQCSRDDVRCVNDTLSVVQGGGIPIAVVAQVWLLNDTPMDVFTNLQANFETSFKTIRRLGRDVTRAWILNQLAVAGVYDVNLISPAANAIVDNDEYPVLTSVNLQFMGRAT